MDALTRAILDGMKCSNPDCTEEHGPLYFHAACHPSGEVEAFYENGVVQFDRKECGSTITRVAVAGAPG